MTSHPAQIVRIASRRARSFGAVSLSDLVSALPDDGAYLSVAQARETLATADVRFVDDDWFWLPGSKRDRLSALTRRILAVCSPLDLTTVREGICRAERRRRTALIPPVRVLHAYYDAHPDFVLMPDGCVQPSGQLDYGSELTKTDRMFVEALRASWTGVLDRATFRAGCLARGMKRDSFGSAITYSPVLDHPAPGAWCLRGTRFSPIILAALRHAKGA